MIAPYIDCINVSLNEVNKDNYNKLCRPENKEKAFEALLAFTKRCSSQIKDTVMSVVDVIGEDKIKKAKEIAADCGARLRVRKYEK